MEFRWDPNKATRNRRKHGIDFTDAVLVLLDEFAITIEADGEDEQRFVTIGTDPLGRTLVVVYAWREDDVRLISARRATTREQREYKDKR